MKPQAMMWPLCVTLVLHPFVVAGEKEASVGEEQLVAWVKETAMPIDTLDWLKVGLEPLKQLESMLEGKRIVYLGEPDHFILLGHNLHLSRKSGQVEWEGRRLWPTIGTHLSNTLKG